MLLENKLNGLRVPFLGKGIYILYQVYRVHSWKGISIELVMKQKIYILEAPERHKFPGIIRQYTKGIEG